MSILARRCLGRSRLVAELVENWQLEHKQAMVARDVEELVLECVDLGKLIQHCGKSLFARLGEEDFVEIDEIGDTMRAAIAKSLLAFESVRDDVRMAEHKGFIIDNSVSLENVILELRQMEAEFKNNWPTVDRQQLADSLAAYNKGDYRMIEDLLNEAKNCGSISG
jgi:hypothetical protein